jgi:hypothetical protein
MPPPAEIKRVLREAGFEIYRTQGNVVHIADRVRENLIMDSGVRIDSDTLCVSFYARCEKNSFPGDGEDALYARAAALGQAALDRGYSEKRRFVTEMTAPGEPSRLLDHWYQVQFEVVADDIDGAVDHVRFVFALDKTATR